MCVVCVWVIVSGRCGRGSGYLFDLCVPPRACGYGVCVLLSKDKGRVDVDVRIFLFFVITFTLCCKPASQPPAGCAGELVSFYVFIFKMKQPNQVRAF